MITRWLFFMGIMTLTSFVNSETVYYPNSKIPMFSIQIPNAWTIELEEDVLYASTYDDSLTLVLWTLYDIDNMEQAIDSLDMLIIDLIPEMLSMKKTPLEMKDWPVHAVKGSGFNHNEEIVHTSMVIFGIEDESFFIVTTFGSPDLFDENYPMIRHIIQSIKPE